MKTITMSRIGGTVVITLRVMRPFLLILGMTGLMSLTRADQRSHHAPRDAALADDKKLDKKVKEIAGSAEFLRSVPKHFATLQAVDPARGQVTLLLEGEVLAKVWQLVPDAEVKVSGWWGRLSDLAKGDRVWVWFKTDRKKQAVAVSMIADEISEQDIHGQGISVEWSKPGEIKLTPEKGSSRLLTIGKHEAARKKGRYYVQSAGKKARLILDKEGFQARRDAQRTALRKRWLEEGLPATVAFVHVFSGEMDLVLDHETMRWARSLQKGDQVKLKAEPPIQALVKEIQPWRERTQLRLVVHSFDLADLSTGQRTHLLRERPAAEVETAQLPPDLDRPRSKEERVEWFMASIYCTCGVRGDVCTGHFYTLASCNPNGCGMPNHMRRILRENIEKGLNDRQIFEALLKEFGTDLLRPHLLP